MTLARQIIQQNPEIRSANIGAKPDNGLDATHTTSKCFILPPTKSAIGEIPSLNS